MAQCGGKKKFHCLKLFGAFGLALLPWPSVAAKRATVARFLSLWSRAIAMAKERQREAAN
jgi:hypothetical protein